MVGTAHGRRLQAVAQRLVVEHHRAARLVAGSRFQSWIRGCMLRGLRVPAQAPAAPAGESWRSAARRITDVQSVATQVAL